MQSKTRDFVRIAVFAALIAVLSQIAIPMPSGVPVTLQTFAIALTGYAVGAKRGAAAVCVYLALGAVGAPVFANFTGGFVKLVGVTGGFLWGFIVMAVLCGLACGNKNVVVSIALGVAGLLVCHLCGVLQFSLVASASLWKSAMTVSIPYLAKDVVSVALAWCAARSINAALAKTAAAA